MRGKATMFCSSSMEYGITPAYAGKSHLMYAQTSIYQDHPRLCGEKATALKFVACIAGSPPPMRGKAGIAALVAAFVGITPAYAGKSFEERTRAND